MVLQEFVATGKLSLRWKFTLTHVKGKSQ